jgi:hypothetical protein
MWIPTRGSYYATNAKTALETIKGVNHTVFVVPECPITDFVVGGEIQTAPINKGCGMNFFLQNTREKSCQHLSTIAAVQVHPVAK